MSEISAYEKMLQDGTAFKEVDMTMHSEPNLMEAQGASSRSIDNEELIYPNKDEGIGERRQDNFEEFDSVMEQRISNLRRKMNGEGSEIKVGKLMTPTQKEIASLKKRIAKLEEALIVIMQTQEQLFE
jgi:hypothetical protein